MSASACSNRRSCRYAALLLAASGLIAACIGPISVRPVSKTRNDQAEADRLLRSRDLSAATLQTLRLLDLDKRATADPVAAIALLNSHYKVSARREILAAEAEMIDLLAGRIESQDRDAAAGLYLLAAARAFEYLVRGRSSFVERAFDARFVDMSELYSHAVGAYLSYLQDSVGNFQDHQRETLLEPIRVRIAKGDGLLEPNEFDELLVARTLKVKGLRNHYARDGIGTPLVTVRGNPQLDAANRFSLPEGVVQPATAVLRFGKREGGARKATLSVYDPRAVETVRLGSHEVPLAADFTTPYAYLLAIGDVRRLARQGLQETESLPSLLGLYLLEPYDPERIPIIMVHGIRSSPLAWMELTNDLSGDRELQRAYQVWQYVYPTSLPYVSAAVLLRRSVDEVLRTFDHEQAHVAASRMVIVAHSMGGLMVKTMIADSGMGLWDSVFTVAPERLSGSEQDIELMREGLIFEPKPYVRRVIFVATPHRGSEAANTLVGHLGSSLMHPPDEFQELLRRIAAANPGRLSPEMGRILAKGGPTSIRALSPGYPLLSVLADLPIEPRVAYHSIMGDRGVGGDGPKSDGVVTFESSHLDGADSELLVPAGHGAYSHPLAIAEIKRILRRHLEESRQTP